METAVTHFIILGVISGLTNGAGVLPDGPLNAAVGGTVMFTTTLARQEKPFSSVSWNFEYEDRITFFPSTGSLQLRNLSLHDSGEYTVNINQPGEAQKNGIIRLDVYERISGASVKPSINLPIEGNSVNLSCEAAGSLLNRTWMKDGSDLIPANNIILQDNNRVLSFHPLKKTDSGQYSCNISNPVSSGAANYNMVVNYGPENLQITGPSEISVGQTLTLTCSAEATPSARYTWTLNGTEIHNSSVFTEDNVELSDSGNYTCQALNNVTGRALSAVHGLSITERTSGASVKPSINLPIERNPVNLICEAAGSFLSRTWMKDGSDLIPANNIILQDNNRVLSFQPLKKTDTGQYSCNIKNPVSNGAANYNMVVNYGPENLQITGPSEISVGQTLTLTCSAESTPSARYTWTLNGTEIHNSSVFTEDNVELSDSGNYTCQAMNRITGRALSVVHGLSITDKTLKCSAGCIAGIMITALVICGAAAGGGYILYLGLTDATEDSAYLVMETLRTPSQTVT
ncbi:cell adhesion molecule CEACAM5-like [Chaetodon trifascialis]|uniref:cell adhesion molecule CEACAM5-like n=1 Tax=Chaetodon trifascialis TaxID=109706 RepID=UPI003995EADE